MANCSTKADVFKQALNIFDFVARELVKGNKFILETEKEQREVVFPIMATKISSPQKRT
jgi:hypothetical protein